MSKKSIYILIVVIVVAMIVWVVKADNKKASGDSIKIGVVAPLTGGAAPYGQNLVKGIEMALADLKDTKYKYELVIEDDGTNPAQSASAAQKLINIDKVQAIITTTSGTGNAVKPIAVSAKIPNLCVCSDARVADGVYSFTNLPFPEDEARGWLDYAKGKNIKTLAMLNQIHPGWELLSGSLKKYAGDFGIKIVFEERFDVNSKDFNTMISKARKTNADAYLLGAYSPALDIMGKELKDLNVKNVVGMGTFAITADPKIFEGDWFSDASLADLSFKDRFEKTNPDLRFNVRTAPYGYDSLNMLVLAFEDGKDGVALNLANIKEYSGKSGLIKKDVGSGNFKSPVGIWVIKNGKAEVVK